jgi:hypothetical protein
VNNFNLRGIEERERAWQRFHDWETTQSDISDLPERLSWFDAALQISRQFPAKTEDRIATKVDFIREIRRKLALMKSA